MRRLLLKLIGITAALMAAVFFWVLATLPPAARRPWTPAPADVLLVSGAYHVHSSRSDGSGSVDDIARAAARAGLQFVILTDHGDATRPPETTYRHGVLCIDAVEISTTGGHVVALNLQGASPYPLAGEPADVVEDIHRFGGWAVAAHPDSSREALQWRSRDVSVDGLEWFNVDTEWRAHGVGALAATAARAWFRPAESVATLFQPPRLSFERWDTELRRGPTFAIAALDAHARVGTDDHGDVPRALALSLPGYETMFRTMAQTVRLTQPLTGDPQRDAQAVMAAIAMGRSYSVVRAFADAPRALDFRAMAGAERVELGGSVIAEGPVTLHASVPAEFNARLVLFADGREVASGLSVLDHQAEPDRAYRLEARLADLPMPWIVSNAIRIGRPAAPPRASPAANLQGKADGAARTPLPPATWVIEADQTSTATIKTAGEAITLRYQLGAGTPAGQYVALASGAAGDLEVDRLEFTATSRRPIRLSVQVRLVNGSESRRWRRSVYVDDVPRRISVALAEMVAVDSPSSPRPRSSRVQSVLVVIDTVNARPGDSGEVVLQGLGVVVAK